MRGRSGELATGDDPLGWARSRGVELFGDAARLGGEAAGFHREPHRVGHLQGVFGAGDPGVEQDAVASQFHRQRDVGRRADAGVDDDGVVRVVPLEVFEDDPDVVRVQDPLARTDRTPGGHHAGGAGGFEVASHHRVVAGVNQDVKPLGDENLGRLQGGHRVGQQGSSIGENLQLDPVGARVVQAREEFAAETGGPEGVLGGEAAGGVGQDRIAVEVEKVDQAPPLLVGQAFAADGDGDDLGAAGRQAVAHQLQGRVLAGADQEATGESVRTNLKLRGFDRLDGVGLDRAAAHQRHDLDIVAILNGGRVVLVPGDEVAVALDGDVLGLDPEQTQEAGHGQGFGEVALLAVQGDRHGRKSRSEAALICPDPSKTRSGIPARWGRGCRRFAPLYRRRARSSRSTRSSSGTMHLSGGQGTRGGPTGFVLPARSGRPRRWSETWFFGDAGPRSGLPASRLKARVEANFSGPDDRTRAPPRDRRARDKRLVGQDLGPAALGGIGRFGPNCRTTREQLTFRDEPSIVPLSSTRPDRLLWIAHFRASEPTDQPITTESHRPTGTGPRREVVPLMPESDHPARLERSRSSGVVPEHSSTPRSWPTSDDTDLLNGPSRLEPPEADSGLSPPGSERSQPGSGRSAPRALPNLGEKIDEFRLLEPIGAGGMGAVFRAVDLGLDRQVALKILPPEQAVDPEVVRRYHQEGRAAARLDHENIARVYTIGDDGRYHYIAFEFIDGVTIRQMVIRDGPLTVADAVHFTLQIARALVHAAEREVIHRDIKPSNIIITPSGRAKLVDMGLARQFERRGEADLTQTGMTLGTFDYISPEQARDPRDVDIRGDLYSLGCTLFHMLSGRPPFPEGTVLQKLLQHREDTPTDIRRLNPNVPDALAAILVKLLAKDRDRRYQTPEHLAHDLTRISPRKLVTLPSVRATPNWARHLFWGGPSLVFLLVLGGMVWWGDGPSPPTPGRLSGRSRPDPNLVPIPTPFTPGVFAGSSTGLAPASGPATSSLSNNPVPPREVAVTPLDDLAQVLAGAPPRSTILLAERGPYELQADRPIRLDHADLTIRAEAGVHPVIRLTRNLDSPPTRDGAMPATEAALVDIRGGRVVFDGIDFLVDPSSFESAFGASVGGVGNGDRPSGSGPRVLAAIVAEDAEVVIKRCSFRRVSVSAFGAGVGPASNWRPTAIHLLGSGRTTSGRNSTEAPIASLSVDASDFEGYQVGLLTSGPVDVSIRDVAFGPTLPDQASIWADSAEASPSSAEFRLEHVSGLLGEGPMFRSSGTTPRVLARHSVFGAIPASTDSASSPTLVAIDNPDRLDWRGADNLYARVGTYLRAGGSRARATIRGFVAWSDGPSTFRESGSTAYNGAVWERLPATSVNLANSPESPRSFRLTLPRAVVHPPGARWGPLGPLPAPTWLATASPPNRTLTTDSAASSARPTNPDGLITPPRRPAGAESEPRAEPPDDMPDGLAPMPMPVPEPTEPERSPDPESRSPETRKSPTSPTVFDQSRAITPGSPPGPVSTAADRPEVRTTAQFLAALRRDEPGDPTILLAADADLDLPSVRLAGPSRWTIRAAAGASRPRIRFRDRLNTATESRTRTAWLTLQFGGLRIEGVDLILPGATGLESEEAADPRSRSAFALGSGATDLVLADCTVTIEGEGSRSSLVAVLPAHDSFDVGPFGDLFHSPFRSPTAPPARVRFHDCTLRSAGNLIDVAPGRSVELDLDHSVVATDGVLVDGHGREAGRPPGLLRVTLRRIAARMAGGLVRLESDRDHPSLPVASILASDAIIALTDAATPLIQVDGQGDLASLRDRVVWQERSVAYHGVATYRRDQTSRLGVPPTRIDRAEWVATHDPSGEGASRANLPFVNERGLAQPASAIRPEDFRLDLRSPSPDSAIGPDLFHVPDPPPAIAAPF